MKEITVTAQDLYDLRDATGFVSGNDLATGFLELTGDMSPSGNTPVTIPANHWLREAAMTADNGRHLGTQMDSYLGAQIGFTENMMKLAVRSAQNKADAPG